MNEINKNIKFMENNEHIFIPFLGPSNAGKTTILNGIIGKDILPTNLSESTKRGIIISYCNSEKITIRTVNLQSKKEYGEICCDLKFGAIIGNWLAQVKQILIDINYNFPEKKEDFFYLVQTRIKLFDELKLEENYKKMICLIDLPGYGTKNIFEKVIYNKLLSISSSFIFVVKNSLIKDEYTQEILEKLFIQAKTKKKKSYS